MKATTGQGVDRWYHGGGSEACNVDTDECPVHAANCQWTHRLTGVLEDIEVSLDAGEGGCW